MLVRAPLFLLFLMGTFLHYLVFYYLRSRTGLIDRAQWMHYWAKVFCRWFGIQVHSVGKPPDSGIICSNHISYLDILVLGSLCPLVFVSKIEVRNWPFVGQLTTLAGTIYVDRSKRSEVVKIGESIASVLKEKVVVAVFPEGTSSDGSQVLPFYPSLLEPVVQGGWPVTPVRLTYSVPTGKVETDVAYWGEMAFVPHFIKLMAKKRVNAEVSFLPVQQGFINRKQAARDLHEMISNVR